MSNLLKAFCFKNGKLQSSSVINMRQKDNVLESFRQSLNQESIEDLSVAIYMNSSIVDKSDYLLKINVDSIEIQDERFTKETVRVNWISEGNLSEYYSPEEMELILENMQALMNFIPESANAKFSGSLLGMESVVLLESSRQENFEVLFDGVKSIAQILSENPDMILISGEDSQVPSENEIMHFVSVKSEFSFPNEIPEKFKEIDTQIKERYTIETLYPIEIIEGVSND